MPDEESRKARTEALKGGTWSLYYTTPEGGRVRAKAHGTGTSGHAYYLMSEGEALEQARDLGDMLNVERIEVVRVSPSRDGRNGSYRRRTPRPRARYETAQEIFERQLHANDIG